uniref:hypothetical protein n=1 Tax=Trichocoleus desertorum TaxID=1481672 RepID=UPI0025B6130A|nr:hypothetical protein [Trichocoleus desertorum]
MANPIDIDFVKTSKSEKETKDVLNDIRGSYQNLSTIEIKEEVQEEIAKVVILLQRTEKIISRNSPRKVWWEKIPNIITPDKRRTIQEEAKTLINSLDLAVSSLLFKDKPNLYFSRNIRIDVERVLCRHENPIFGYLINRFMDAQRSPSTPLKVISGLIFALIAYGTIASTITCSLLIYSLYSSARIADNSPIAGQIDNLNEDISLINVVINDRLRLSKLNDPIILVTPPVVGSTNGKKTSPTITKESADLKGIEELYIIKDNLQSKLTSAQDKLKLFKSDSEKNIKTIIEVLLVISAGTLGSIVSILIRIEDFQDKKYLDRLVPFLIGAFKPIIGASFAAFFFALISSEIVTIPSLSTQMKSGTEAQKDKRTAFIFAVAFVVGFSERIAKDTIGRAEEMMGGERVRDTGVAKIEESHLTQQVITSNSLSGENSQVIVTESKTNKALAAFNGSQTMAEAAQNDQDS